MVVLLVVVVNILFTTPKINSNHRENSMTDFILKSSQNLTISNPFMVIATSVEADLIKNWLHSKRAATTRHTYQQHLNQFFKFTTGTKPNPQTLGQFLTLAKHQAISVVLSYLSHLRDGLNRAPSTINVALSAIKSLVNYASSLGQCGFSLSEIKSEKNYDLS
jgi:hypothetical protein